MKLERSSRALTPLAKIAPAVMLALALACACSSEGATDAPSEGVPGTPPGQTPSPTDPGAPPAPPAGGSSGAPGGGPGGGPGEPAAVPYVHYDVNHVISTGQSNSVAHEGRPVLSSAQPYGNLMFDVGIMTSGVCEQQGCRTYQKPNGFVPLVEGDTFWYPVETMSAGLANQATKIATTKHGLPKHDVLVSLAGRNGLTYWCLRRGGCNFIDPTYLNAFEENIDQVRDAKAIATAKGKSYVVRAVTSVHGESDDYAYATGTQQFPLDGTNGEYQALKNYGDALVEWQRDYEAAVKEVTGQAEAVPLFVSQFSGWNDIATSAVTQFQYEAHVKSAGKVRIVTPGYALEWHEDCRHYSNHGERHLGEYFAKAYARTVIEGRTWEPVHPKKVTRSGNVISAQFFVPAPPLVFDTERVTNPGDYGFEVVDAAGTKLAISSVALTGPDTVAVTLAQPPTGAIRLRYAFTGVPLTCPGRFVGPRGNLRDSDATPSQNGYELFNWGLHFQVPVE